MQISSEIDRTELFGNLDVNLNLIKEATGVEMIQREDQLILNPLAEKFRLPRHPRAGGLQRHADEHQNEDNPEADVQAMVKIRQR